ncbi:hypothetical protein CEXT_356861 [Caerostris extrusa]|uniref:Uncharacterized protein n=1 Tax=Caerostris extrusa TaxID=172846 RepID=A0AAV4P6S4_CAEEX|nr:hypothetical protein CEXT_356861 [Caerostris extrusa]
MDVIYYGVKIDIKTTIVKVREGKGVQQDYWTLLLWHYHPYSFKVRLGAQRDNLHHRLATQRLQLQIVHHGLLRARFHGAAGHHRHLLLRHCPSHPQEHRRQAEGGGSRSVDERKVHHSCKYICSPNSAII